MHKSTVSLNFNCSRKWDSMLPQEGGRFCHDCQKKVTDYTNIQSDKLEAVLQKDTSEEFCGKFYAHQLDKPFHNWRDSIVLFYQKTVFRSSGSKFSRTPTLLLMSALLLLTGCYRHLTGRVAPKKHHQKTRDLTSAFPAPVPPAASAG